MNITEFLEARIAEDEADMQRWAGAYGAPEWAKTDDNFGGTDDYQQVTMGYGRALAECAAKRAILDTYRSALRHEAGADVSTELAGKLTLSGIAQGLEIAIQFLATTYKRHPDYRQEWA